MPYLEDVLRALTSPPHFPRLLVCGARISNFGPTFGGCYTMKRYALALLFLALAVTMPAFAQQIHQNELQGCRHAADFDKCMADLNK